MSPYAKSFLEAESSQLVIEFLIVFQRLEFALKNGENGKYLKGGSHAEPDWDIFIKEHGEIIEKSTNLDVIEAIQYFNSKPPKKQIVINKCLSWKHLEYKSALDTIRTIRNNLFHGGKFPSGPMKEYERDIELIKHALVIANKLSETDYMKEYF